MAVNDFGLGEDGVGVETAIQLVRSGKTMDKNLQKENRRHFDLILVANMNISMTKADQKRLLIAELRRLASDPPDPRARLQISREFHPSTLNS